MLSDSLPASKVSVVVFKSGRNPQVRIKYRNKSYRKIGYCVVVILMSSFVIVRL